MRSSAGLGSGFGLATGVSFGRFVTFRAFVGGCTWTFGVGGWGSFCTRRATWWLSFALAADASVEQDEVDHEGQFDFFQVLTDSVVALSQAGYFAGEALDSPGAAGSRTLEPIHVGEVTGTGHG
jgi:hypothetical protein